MSIIDEMNIVLSDDILNYCMAMYADTRLNIDIKTQYTITPVGIDVAINFMKKNQQILSKAIQLYNYNAQSVSLQIDKLTDPLRRIALWGNYVHQYGR
jgi:hypothetical protein